MLMFLNPVLIVGQFVLVSLAKYQSLSLLYGLFSLIIGSVATYAGSKFRKSLGEYFSGSYISNVS